MKREIPNVTNVATTTALNAKINEVNGKIPSITNLAFTAAVTAVENKISNVSNLVKETDCNTKDSEIKKKIADHDHDKYFTTPEFNRLSAENFTARLAQTNLAIKTILVV